MGLATDLRILVGCLPRAGEGRKPPTADPSQTGLILGAPSGGSPFKGDVSIGALTSRVSIAYDRVLFTLPAGRRVRVTGPDFPVYTLKGLSGQHCTTAPHANECRLLVRCLAPHSAPNFTLPASPGCLRSCSPQARGKSSKPEAFPRRAPGITPALAGENCSPRIGRELHRQEWVNSGGRRPVRSGRRSDARKFRNYES